MRHKIKEVAASFDRGLNSDNFLDIGGKSDNSAALPNQLNFFLEFTTLTMKVPDDGGSIIHVSLYNVVLGQGSASLYDSAKCNNWFLGSYSCRKKEGKWNVMECPAKALGNPDTTVTVTFETKRADGLQCSYDHEVAVKISFGII